jgi:hypothetical protein
MDIKKIRELIEKNHGGFKTATDEQVMRLWEALPREVQERYKEKPNAAGN